MIKRITDDELIEYIDDDVIRSLSKNKDFQIIAQQMGIDTAKQMIKQCGGMVVSVPTLSPIALKQVYVRYCKENFNGANYNDLALTLGIQVKTVRKYLSE